MLWVQQHNQINQCKLRPNARTNNFHDLQNKSWVLEMTFQLVLFYIDNGRSILRFFFLANLTCFVTFMHKSSSIVMLTKIIASRICLKYNETAEKTRKARMTSSHITNITTSTLHPQQVGKKTQPLLQAFLPRNTKAKTTNAKFKLDLPKQSCR